MGRAPLRIAALLDLIVVRVAQIFSWLVLGVVLFLFAQWPVREWFGSVTRLHIALNDYGQLFHATVFLVGAAYALATDRHVRLDAFRPRFPLSRRAAIELAGHLLFVLPWLAVLGYFGADLVVRSLSTSETFPETGTPGYPLMRLAFVLFVVLMALASVGRVLRAATDIRGSTSA